MAVIDGGCSPPGPPATVRVTGITADARPLDATFTRPVQDPVTPCGFTVRVRVAGVVPDVGVAERKLLHVVSEIDTVNGDAPAVLARVIVWLSGPGPAPPPGPPPPEFTVNDAGF